MKTFLVTGASSGFGREIVRGLAADGHRVVAVARRKDRLAQLADELGEAVLAWVLDVTDGAAVKALPRALPQAWSVIDGLVNNAGLALGTAPAQEASLDDWEAMVATNVLGLIRVTHAFLPAMVARGAGDVINIGSTAANYPYPGGNVYGASKAFVNQFTLGLKADLAGTGVRVTDVQPGLVGGTEFSVVRNHGDQGKADAVYADTTPLTATDVANVVRWVIALPAHVNINRVEMMPNVQGPGPLTIKRR